MHNNRKEKNSEESVKFISLNAILISILIGIFFIIIFIIAG